MKGAALPVWICVVVLAVSAYGGLKLWRAGKSESPALTTTVGVKSLASGTKLTEFTLTERSGRKFHSSSLAGDVWVASVFFSACPSVCLELNKTIAELQKDKRFHDVKFVSITCDTKNDTPAVLSSYANRFAADKDRWFFCTGEQAEVEKVAHDMLQIAVQGVTHSERAVIFDRTGKTRGGYVIANPRFVADRVNFEQTLLECLAEPRSPSTVAANDLLSDKSEAETKTSSAGAAMESPTAKSKDNP